MLPSFSVLGIKIFSYQLCAFLGVVASVLMFLWAKRKEKMRNFTANRMIFVMVIGLIVLLVSAFIFNSLFHSIERGEIVFGGITWLGGVVGLFVFMIIAFHKLVPEAKGNEFKYFSLMIPGMVLGHAFGRVGCFLAGCCYGMPTDGPFGVIFPEGSAAANQYGYGTPVLPTQLFEAAFELIFFAVMMFTYKKSKYFEVEIYSIGYGVFRFILEFFRGDDRGSTGFFLTPAQFLCILFVTAGVLVILTRKGIIFKKIYQKMLADQDSAAKEMVIIDKRIEDEKAVDRIGEIYALKQKGLITDKEYEEKKKELLKKI